jgi:hypothetical protein
MVRAHFAIVFAFSLTASAASGQVFTIWAEAPGAVGPGETFTVAFWGSVESDLWIDGQSAMAGFGIDALGEGAIAGVTEADVASWAAEYAAPGVVLGDDVVGISGGQLHSPFFESPPFDLSNPILLFTIAVTAGQAGSIAYTPGNPNPNGGLSFYPDEDEGASIIAPNDAGTALVLEGATTRIVPAPMTLGPLLAGGFAAVTTRRRTP